MSGKRPARSPIGRMARLGGLAGRVGASMVSARIRGMGRSEAEREQQRMEALLKNAGRVVDTLGELKGAAMKVGQMLSLHEGLVPPEVAEVLQPLQGQTPSVPFEEMEAEIRRQLPNFDELFESLEPEAFAAASIGQVHRGRLRDGRDVAVKIQYPDIERIVKADLTNLRRLFQSLFALVSEAEFEPMWDEMRTVLLQELDYGHEAANVSKMHALHADVPEIVIPAVVDEASARGVLTMEFCAGIPLSEAATEEYARPLRDKWGQALFKLQFRGLFEHGLLHADPNAGNFAFREDGTMVLYDHGCLKPIPDELREGYAHLLLAGSDKQLKRMPEILFDMGILDEAGGPVGRDLTDPYVEIFSEVFREEPPYRFGEDETVYERMVELGFETWSDQMDVRFPQQIIFIQRTLSGHFGNLSKLGAIGPWRSLARGYAEGYLATTV